MTHPTKHERTTREIIRDYMIYIAIGVGLVLGVMVWVDYIPKKYWIGERWGGLVLATMVIFGFVLRSCKRFWRRPPLWVAVTAVFFSHLIFWIVLLKRWETFRLPWFALLLAPELIVIGYILGWCEIATEEFKRFSPYLHKSGPHGPRL